MFCDLACGDFLDLFLFDLVMGSSLQLFMVSGLLTLVTFVVMLLIECIVCVFWVIVCGLL